MSVSAQPVAWAHFCGDGVVNQLTEQCDGSDDSTCPGLCSDACKCAVCGDGTVDEPVEDCDGANAFFCPGYCLPSCKCPLCGNDVAECPEICDGQGAGSCPAACAADCTCASPCGAQPMEEAACRITTPGRALLLYARGADAAKDRFRWKWRKGAASSTGDFSNPPNGLASYHLCIYDASGRSQPLARAQLQSRDLCRAPRWKVSASGAFKYRDRNAPSGGITRLTLGPGAAGKAKVLLQSKGPGTERPSLPLALPVVVQLLIQNTGGTECWQTTYTTARVNNPQKFRAKGPRKN